MSAEEVLAEHACDENGFRCYGCDWALEKHVSVNDGTEHGAHQLDMLNAAGYAVVELPKQQIIPTGWGQDCIGAWPVGGPLDSPVSAWPKGEVAMPDGDFMSAAEARLLALGLLAAADAAERAS